MAERAYPEDPAYVNKTKYYYALVDRYRYGSKFTAGRVSLDVPCGSGWGGGLIGNARALYGLELSREALQYASKRFSGRYACGTMSLLPFRADAFEVALCFEGIEHISREEGILFFSELKRVVIPGGVIVGSVPILDAQGQGTDNPFHKFEYPEGYLRLLLETSFEIIEYEEKPGGDGPIVFFALKNNRRRTRVLIPSMFGQGGELVEGLSRAAGDCDTVYLLCERDCVKFERDPALGRIPNLKFKSWRPPRSGKGVLGTFLSLSELLRGVRNRLLQRHH